jgi:hypothetical protein
MSKRTHKFKALGNVAVTVESAATVQAAADALGVNRSSVTRWIRAGKVPRPGGQRPSRRKGPVVAGPRQSPQDWAATIRRAYELSPTELQLVALAEAALTLARTEDARPADRLAAMSRYQSLVRQLELEDAKNGEAEAPQTDNLRQWPRRA